MTDEIIEAEVIRVQPRPKRLFETWRDYVTVGFLFLDLVIFIRVVIIVIGW